MGKSHITPKLLKEKALIKKPVNKANTEGEIMEKSPEEKYSQNKGAPSRRKKIKRLPVNFNLPEELVIALDQLAEEKAEGSRTLAMIKILRGEWQLKK